MKKRIAWVVVSGLMVLALVISSCAQAPTTPTKLATPIAPAPTATTAPAKPAEKAPVTPTVEKPKYGGELKVALASDITSFDEISVARNQSGSRTLQITNEELWGGDWTKGPAGGYGANESDWSINTDIWDRKSGRIAESWEMNIGPQVSTATWHIRKGIRWALNANSEASRLVNGRELTGDDVLYSLKKHLTDTRSYLYLAQKGDMVELYKNGSLKITQPDKWTIKIEAPTDFFRLSIGRLADSAMVYPPEVMEKYNGMNDWRNSVGTGPFMLTERVSGSSLTMQKNPNYWMKDPIGPGKGNQLPYFDAMKFLILPDLSTRIAALRTAKLDIIEDIDWEEAASLRKTVPQLVFKKFTPSSPNPTFMRTDHTPFNDKRVRRALFMALDFEAMRDKYFGGDAMILSWPIIWHSEYAGAYLGLDDPEMPESVKELYRYNPEKAKQLLKEAGYPNGFKTWVDIQNLPEKVDYYSIYKDMWSKVGVDLEIRARETAAHQAIWNRLNSEQMTTGPQQSPALLYNMNNFSVPSQVNYSFISDLYVESVRPQMQRLAVTDEDAAQRLHRELMKYVLDQAWVIPEVRPPSYIFWWPWIKNYNGEYSLSYTNRHHYGFLWYDEALKKSMGY